MIVELTKDELRILVILIAEVNRNYLDCSCEDCAKWKKTTNKLQQKLSHIRDSGEAPASASTLANKQTEKEETNDRS